VKINKDLLWDCNPAERELQSEAFQRFYVARVLANGTMKDLEGVGLETIRRLLPELWLPAAIREFWEWYFGWPHAQPTRRDPYFFPKRAA
jgi:hypothetical protein